LDCCDCHYHAGGDGEFLDGRSGPSAFLQQADGLLDDAVTLGALLFEERSAVMRKRLGFLCGILAV